MILGFYYWKETFKLSNVVFNQYCGAGAAQSSSSEHFQLKKKIYFQKISFLRSSIVQYSRVKIPQNEPDPTISSGSAVENNISIAIYSYL